MHKLSLRYMKTGGAVSLILILGLSAHFLSDWIQFYGSIAISFISIGSMFLLVLNSYLWYWPVIKVLYEFPDMRGVYEGTLQFRYIDGSNQEKTGTLKAVREISQNGSGLFIRSTVYKSNGEISSVSTANNVELQKEDNNTIKLIFHYHNEGSVHQNFPPHDGTEILRFKNSNGVKTLTGEYYTNRNPFQTKGNITLTRK